MLKFFKKTILILLLLILISSLYAKNPVRIKDIAVIGGIRDNHLMGFGLVCGLQGRGDSRGFKLTQKMLQSLANNYGFNIDIKDVNSKNIAGVLVTANVGPFSRKGDTVDITISSVGDCKSLEGGVLLQTPLQAADGSIYAVAQGRIIAGNSQNTATIPDGAIIEKDIVSNFINQDKINIVLKYPDFVTVNQIKEAILTLNNELVINAVDPGLIEITLGEEEAKNPIDFIARLEVLTVTPDYISAVVIDKKTGVIVSGEDIIIQGCSISTPFAQVTIDKNKKYNFEINSQSIGELVKTLNELGLKTDEIVSLIEAIHKIGAINAKLILL